MKIIFIEPPLDICKPSSDTNIHLPLLWVLALSSYLKLRFNDISLHVLDGGILSLKKILKILQVSRPDFVGICPKFYSYSNALKIARVAKRVGAKVVMGGPHAGFLAQEILFNRGSYSEDYCVDACVYGDGEKAFCEYVSGKSLKEIKNLVYVDKKSGIKKNPVEYLNLTGDEFRLDYSLVDYAPYLNSSKNKLFPVYTHKGCFYGKPGSTGCLFCGGDKTLRLRKPEVFWEEINFLTRELKVTHVSNLADGFPLNIKMPWFKNFYKATRICPEKPIMRIRTLPFFINKESVRILNELNIRSVRLPVTDRFPGCAVGALTDLKKDDFKKILEPFNLLNEANIKTVTYFMPGIMKETGKDIRKIYELYKILKALKSVRVIFARGHKPVPGSRGWQMLLEKTGDKYKNKDLINWREVSHDWIKYFGNPELMSILRKLEKDIIIKK